ncbi:MAG: hypothetical protein WB952_12710 [Terriglobales bacterium]
MLPFMGSVIRADDEILRVLEASTDSRFDRVLESDRATFKWSLREFTSYGREIDGSPSSIVGVTLARSLIIRSGQTVTDHSIEEARSELSPPAADTIHMFFYMARHLVAVEYNSTIMDSDQWRSSLHSILDECARSLEFQSVIRLEPVPKEAAILNAFRSFQILTRLRVRLRIPNPELDRRTERLRKELVSGEIREYTQDMRNPRGLSKSDENLPFATAAMAQAGYKEGDVVMSGIRDGKRTTLRTGTRAARGRIEGLKDFVRGMATNAKSKEARSAIASILEEVDRIVENPESPPGES